MKHYIYSAFTLIILINISACKKDFLDVPNKTVLLQEAYITDLKTMGDYLNGIYVTLGVFSYYCGSSIYNELVADNIKLAAGRSALKPQYDWTQVADNGAASQLLSQPNANPIWFNGYKVARYCSFVIENVDNYRSENPVKADDIKGQAYALRALAHFLVVTTFAQSYNFTPDGSHIGVPYINTTDWTTPVSRQSVSEVYTNMIEDLNEAIKLLPENPTTTILARRTLVITPNATKALLARVYLFKEDYAKARDLAKQVIANVPLMASPAYPSKLFTLGETEAIFQLAPSSSASTDPANGGNYATFFAGALFASPILYFNATSDIASIVKEGPQDVRSVWVTSNGAAWDITKFPVNVVSGFSPVTASYYHTVLRSSEMYLTAAEAYARLNDDVNARTYLDAVRQRADSFAPPITATGTALLDSIFKERRKELCFEGMRMLDLQRWKMGVNRIDAPNPAAQNLPYPSDRAIAPIPLPDVEIAGLQQNIGY